MKGGKTGIIAPIDVAQIVVGATKLVETENSYKIVPEDFYHILLILGPFSVNGVNLEEIVGNKNEILDYTGNFEEKIASQKKNIKIFYSDTSLLLKSGSPSVTGKEKQYGYFVRKAFDRTKVVMRILELMMYLRIINKYSKELREKDSYVLMDGPPIYLSQYARLISPSVSKLFEVKAEKIKETFYNVFKHLIGLTKHVKVVPEDPFFINFVWGGTLREFLENQEILIYWLPDIVEGIEESSREKIKVGKITISAFLRMRRELIKKFLSYYPYFGMVRIDMLIPTIAPKEVFNEFFNNLKGSFEEDYKSYDKNKDKEARNVIKSFLNSSDGQERIKEIIKGLEILSWPLPPKTIDPQRWASSVYPIIQTERWIKSKLWNTMKVKSIFEHKDLQEKYLAI